MGAVFRGGIEWGSRLFFGTKSCTPVRNKFRFGFLGIAHGCDDSNRPLNKPQNVIPALKIREYLLFGHMDP